MPTPEKRARDNIDNQLASCGCAKQDHAAINLRANRGITVYEFSIANGEADYVFFVDRQAILIQTFEGKLS